MKGQWLRTEGGESRKVEEKVNGGNVHEGRRRKMTKRKWKISRKYGSLRRRIKEKVRT